jgi:transposase
MADLAYREVYAMSRIKARLRLVTTYHETGSIRQTARRWHTSRQIVRKWLRRYEAEGLSGLEDRSRRPHKSPRQTPPHIEDQVLDAWQKTRYGRHRLALCLRAHGLRLSPRTIRHIFRRRRPPQIRKHRKPLYPAIWAWEEDKPFSLLQTDVKDVHDPTLSETEHAGSMFYNRLKPVSQPLALAFQSRATRLCLRHPPSGGEHPRMPLDGAGAGDGEQRLMKAGGAHSPGRLCSA